MKRLPAHYFQLAAMHHRNGKMKALLRAHGASGPHTFTVLLCEAAARTVGRGVVKMAWDDLCTYGAIETEEAARERLREMEAMKLVKVDTTTRYGFALTLPNWDEWDLVPKDPTANVRQQRHRAKAKAQGQS